MAEATRMVVAAEDETILPVDMAEGAAVVVAEHATRKQYFTITSCFSIFSVFFSHSLSVFIKLPIIDMSNDNCKPVLV